MPRTLQLRELELDSTDERARGHVFDTSDALIPPDPFTEDTSWPPRPALDDTDEVAMTAPVPRLEPDFDAEPLPPLEAEVLAQARMLEVDIEEVGVRTLMGVGARAVRAVAKSGCVEARVASRELRAAPEAAGPRSGSRDRRAEASPRVIVSPVALGEDSSRSEVAPTLAEGSAPLRLVPPPASAVAAAAPVAVASSPASGPVTTTVTPGGVVEVSEVPTLFVRSHVLLTPRGKRVSPMRLVLVLLALALFAGVAAYVTTTMLDSTPHHLAP